MVHITVTEWVALHLPVSFSSCPPTCCIWKIFRRISTQASQPKDVKMAWETNSIFVPSELLLFREAIQTYIVYFSTCVFLCHSVGLSFVSVIINYFMLC